jgi:hypothetical protein
MSVVQLDAQDATLVTLAANGEEDAFTQLYRRYETDGWELSFYMCARKHADARDAVQVAGGARRVHRSRARRRGRHALATSGILESVTRATALTLLGELGVPTVERAVDRTELYLADELFMGTAWEILPVTRVDGLEVGDEPPARAPAAWRWSTRASSGASAAVIPSGSRIPF